MPGPTTFHLVRHASHALLPHTLAGRHPGVGLSEAGHAEARRLAQRFAGLRAAAVVSSPVQRALETAQPIATTLGLDVRVDPGFEEVDFGRWTMARFDDLAQDPGWQRWNRLRSLARCPDGETMHNAQSRALSALMALHGSYPDETIAVVTHADLIKALLASVLGFSLDRLHRLKIDPASVSTLTIFDSDVTVRCINSGKPG